MSAVQQDPTPDLNPETLQALSALMVAQAQEIFVVKAIHGRFNHQGSSENSYRLLVKFSSKDPLLLKNRKGYTCVKPIKFGG